MTVLPLRVDDYFIKKNLSAFPRPYNHWKAETLCSLHVFLIFGCQIGEFFNYNVPKVGHFSQAKLDQIFDSLLIKRFICIHLLSVGWRNLFPVVVLCQFLVLVGNRFWFYILMYLEYNTVVVLC